MPLNPSSYSKIFKSKYVQDDDEEEPTQNLNEDNEDKVLEGTSSSSFVPTYSNPKVQELLSKPKLDFDKIFSSRYLQDDIITKTPSFRSSSLGFETKPTPSFKPNLPPAKDYDKIFTSRYLDDDYQAKSLKSSRKSVINPYLSDEDDADNDEIRIKHLPPSRGGSIRRSVPPKYNESYPIKQFDLKPTYEEDFETKPLRKIYSRSVTPSIRSESSYLRSQTPSSVSSYSRNYDSDDKKEDSSVVLDANLTFILGCKSKLKENVTAVPAFKKTNTKSHALSSKIADFLTRTDHVMEEWGDMGKNRKRKIGDKSMSINGRSKSATNIMIKGFQLYSKANSVDRGNSSRCEDDESTQYEIDEV